MAMTVAPSYASGADILLKAALSNCDSSLLVRLRVPTLATVTCNSEQYSLAAAYSKALK